VRNLEKKRETTRKWFADNPEYAKAYRKAYYEKNKEKLKAQKREWHRKNARGQRKKALAYYYANKDRQLAKNREWQAANPDRVKEIREARQARGYGLDLKTYRKMKKSPCAICGKKVPGKMHIDHCHKTGKVRGRLCHWCNLAIGNMKDNPALLRKAANYLEAHR
jgi:hypothetical protein